MPIVNYSFIIPYYKRLRNIIYVLQNICEIEADKINFEVIICSYEYDASFFDMIEMFSRQINLKVIFTNAPWNVSQARNSAMKQARGEYLVLLDADILLPFDFFKNLEKLHRSADPCCVFAGTLYNYDERVEIDNVDLPPYSFYKENYLSMSKATNLKADYRNDLKINIPWAFCWTALIVVPRRVIEDKSLFFDETFTGWGGEDIEWSYRLHKSEIEIIFNNVWCIHLPHIRNIKSNKKSSKSNYDFFLEKWPCFDVELVCRLGDIRANDMYYDILEIVKKIENTSGYKLCIAECIKNSERDLFIGCLRDESEKIININLGQYDLVNSYLLLGIKLPYNDSAVRNITIIGSVFNMFSDEIKSLIKKEALRVAKKICRG